MGIKKVLITGNNGFIGKNLTLKLRELNNYTISGFDIGNTDEELNKFVKEADVIVHLAGSNRPKEVSEFSEVNLGLTSRLIELVQKQGNKKTVIFASSTQAELENDYGRSKLAAENALVDFAQKWGNVVYIYRFTNVFGKWCRPNYNSVVATFCHNIANDLPINISNENAKVKLIYVDDIIGELVDKINNPAEAWDCKNRLEIKPFYEVTLGELASKIRSFKESRISLLLPDVADDFTKKLYSTYLSYLNPGDFGYKLNKKSDNRGDLTELLKSDKAGQIFISTTKPGITRGNHYHHTKTEKFIVIQGEAEISFRKIIDFDLQQSLINKDIEVTGNDGIITYRVSGSNITVVDIPPGYAHNITNIGNTDLITLFWANEIFDQDKPDTFFEEV